MFFALPVGEGLRILRQCLFGFSFASVFTLHIWSLLNKNKAERGLVY